MLEGKKAPPFALSGSDGKTHRLEDYAGRTVILYFYPRDNTPGCTKESCGFRDRHAELAAHDVVVLGVSPDSIPSHENFIAQLDLPFVLLSDPEAEVMKPYGAWGEKKRYGKTHLGVIRSTVIIGPDGVVRKHWPKIRGAEQHPQQVLDALRQ